MWKCVYLIIFITYLKRCEGKMQCMDQNNHPVDWYVVSKLPKLDSNESLLLNGEAFMYITSETVDQGWSWSSVGIQDKNTLLANTLKPYYLKNDKDLWILYNDQDPRIPIVFLIYGGHTKGIVGADSTGGFWLVQSVPKYPSRSTKGYQYPKTGFSHGQSALCITLTPESLNLVGEVMAYNDPDIYDHRVHPDLIKLYPSLVEVTHKSLNAKYPWYVIKNLTTPGGTSFTAFGKAKKFGKDLYGLVSTQVQSDLLVETWQNTLMPLPSDCSTPHRIMNIKEISISKKGLSYKSSIDHSKWAISTKGFWTCIGDINRTKHQEKRGGGTVCLSNKKLWTYYHKFIEKTEDCATKTWLH